MGRSPRDSNGVEEPDTGGTASKAWEAVRRALGRLVTQTTVARVPQDRLTFSPTLRDAEAVRTPLLRAGVSEERWRPGVQVAEDRVVAIEAGGGDRDLASVVMVVSGDASLHPQGRGVFPLTLPGAACVVHAVPTERTVTTPAVPAAPVVPAGGAARAVSVTLRAPVVAAVGGLGVTAPAVRLHPAARGSRRTGVPTIRAAQVRPGLATLARVPLRRAARPLPAGVPITRAFLPERQRLAATAGLPPEDVALVGVFPDVPLGGIQKLSVEADGTALLLWLKPEMLGPTRVTAKFVTLILGRQRSTGKMLQTIAS